LFDKGEQEVAPEPIETSEGKTEEEKPEAEDEEEEEEQKSKAKPNSVEPEIQQAPVVQQEPASEPEKKDELKYACKKCRRVLFTSTQIISHQNEDSSTKTSRRRGKLRSIEVGVCQMLFVSTVSHTTCVYFTIYQKQTL
jgi:hypothetical protein